MFVAQRLQKIREILLEQEIVDVSSLSEELNVSEVTIRRDFDKLEKENFIKKTYGGAILNKDYVIQSMPRTPVKSENTEEILLIAKIAKQMIVDNDVIYLAGGPISRTIAQTLSDKNIMVVTNDIQVANELSVHQNVKTTVTGGELLNHTSLMIGPRVNNVISEMFITKSFIEVKGIDLNFGYSMASYDEVVIARNLMSLSKEVIALAHFDNFDSISNMRLAPLDAFGKVITNKEISDDFKKFYFNKFIKLYTTYNVVD